MSSGSRENGAIVHTAATVAIRLRPGFSPLLSR
jgi:hypothetical protein